MTLSFDDHRYDQEETKSSSSPVTFPAPDNSPSSVQARNWKRLAVFLIVSSAVAVLLILVLLSLAARKLEVPCRWLVVEDTGFAGLP